MPQIIVKLGETLVQKYSFDKPLVLIGRGLDNDLVLENLSVSRRHAQIELIEEDYYVSDLESANGTFLNGEKVQKHILKNEDVITLGKHKIYFIEDIKVEEEALPERPFDFEETVVMHRIEPCYLVVSEGKPANHTYRIDKPELFIGRDMECDVVIHDWLAAKKHARLNLVEKNYIITDLGTWKGTKVNGQSVKERILLNKDEIEIGLTRLKFLKGNESVEFVSPSKPLYPTPAETPLPKKKEPASKQPIAPILPRERPKPSSVPKSNSKGEYIASLYSPIFHFSTCNWTKSIDEKNRVYFVTVGDAILSRRKSCGTCKPGMEDKDIEFWLKALKDDDDSIQEHAAKMLKKLTGKEYA